MQPTQPRPSTPPARPRVPRLPLWVLIVGAGLALYLTLTQSGGDTTARETITIFSTRFLGVFIEAVPFLLLGTLASGLLEAFITREDIVHFMPRNPILATITGGFLGFAFPVCECGVVPVVRRLYQKGFPLSAGISFLLASPVINPVVIAATYAAFGWGAVLIGRVVCTLLVAIGVGLVFMLGARPYHVLRPLSMARATGGDFATGDDFPPTDAPPATQRRALLPGLLYAFKLAGDEFFEMGRYLILGSMFAAALQTVVAPSTLEALGRGPILSVLVMQALAFLLSVCSTVDAFLALSYARTFTSGSIISFLTFGPMVDIKSSLMFAGVFKPRTVAYLILLPFLLTLLLGVWINLNLGV
jgi:uncharacterized protein